MRNKFTLIALLIFGLSTNPYAQSPGDLDPSFNSTGYYVTDFGFHDNANHILVQPDQKIVVTGVALTTAYMGVLKVLRLNTDGTLDAGFADGGVFTYSPPSSETYGVISQMTPGGKIVVGGIYYNTNTYTADFLLLRLDENGGLDPSFGNGGVVIYPPSTYDDFVQSMAIRDDGKIIVAGTVSEVVGFDIFNTPCIARFTEDGQIDPTFGDGGMTKFAAVYIDNELTSCMIQDDGKIVASGHYNAQFTGATDFDILVVRVDENGVPDAGFGTDGMVLTPIYGGIDDAFGMDIDNDGNIVVSGFTTVPVTYEFDMVVVKYLPNGALDNTFGDAGKVIFNSQAYDVANDVKIQSDNKIVVVGSVGGAMLDPKDFAVWRYLPDGTPDVTFGTNGLVTTSIFPSAVHEFNSVALQSDARIVACGKAQGANNDLAVVRYYPGPITGINDPTDKNTMVVSPNPSGGRFVFTTDEGFANETRLRIFNFSGQEVYQQMVSNPVFEIILEIPDGVYFYEIENSHRTFKGKLVICQ